MMKRLITAWVFVALMLSQAAISAEQSDDAAERLNNLLSKMQSFSARFEQLVLDNSGTRVQESQGAVELKRPGQFRWETLEPFPQLLISNGQTLWLYDQDLEQVTVKQLDERLAQTPALLLSGDLNSLQDAFEVRGPTSGEDGIFDLIPRDTEALFTRMRLYFESGLLREMQLEDNLDQRTSLLFMEQQLNPALADGRFQFVVPDGVDVISE